jgi:hypothetical protein
MQNISGQEINYDLFKLEYDENPAFAELVDRFDANGVVLKTKNKHEPVGQRSDIDTAKSNVNSTAKKAASKLLGK